MVFWPWLVDLFYLQIPETFWHLTFWDEFCIILLFWEFSSPALDNGIREFKWQRVSQVSRTLPSILADLNNAVVWIAFTSTLISKCFNPFTNLCRVSYVYQPHLVLLSSSSSIVFFSSPGSYNYLSLFSLSFHFTLLFSRKWKTGIRQVLLFLLTIPISTRLSEICLFVCISKYQVFCVSFSRTDSGILHIALVRKVKLKYLAQFPVDHLSRLVASSLILFCTKFLRFIPS